MTINEIENIVHSLCKRHPNLTEDTLVTLLTSGGWEDKVIKDAISLFRTKDSQIGNRTDVVKSAETKPHVSEVVSVATQVENHGEENNKAVLTSAENITYYDGKGEEEIIPLNLGIEIEKIEEDKNKIVNRALTPTQILPNSSSSTVLQAESSAPSEVQTTETPTHLDLNTLQETTTEPQSLIQPENITTPRVTHTEIPPDLPMRPFESSTHVWPFSKYIETFHNETAPPKEVTEKAVTNETSPVNSHPPEKSNTTSTHNMEHDLVVKRPVIKRTGFDGEDEGLIFLTGSMLFIIIMLLAYMYANGRL